MSRKLVVLGMMTRMPVAGVVWQTLHYLLGFRALGFDVHYVETHARTPGMLMRDERDDGALLAARFVDRALRPFGLGDRWAYVALHDDARCLGLSQRELDRLYGEAELIVNLHGGTMPFPHLAATGRLVYVETDPVQLQVELAEGYRPSAEFLEAHCAFFTFGENIGAPDCALPAPERYAFRPTRQPVVVDLWAGRGASAPATRYTTIGNWQQPWREIVFRGERYSWSKHHEWARVLDLPARSGVPLELALSSYAPEDRALLEAHGWTVVHGLDVSTDTDVYRDYVAGSRGEFTVAKDQNVRFRTGWFSDRSATYLAAGRPVVTQDTGFGTLLPTGAGLHAWSTLDEAAAAIEAIEADYARSCADALEIARACFDAPRVLGELVEAVGVELTGARGRRRAPSAPPFGEDLVLEPVSRRPTRLPVATIDAVTARPVPVRPAPENGFELASIVVVTCDGLVFTRLCLESVLADTDHPSFELVVVDNGSTDGTPAYLRELARTHRHVRVIANASNRGFPAACNQGLAAARGQLLVLLNNDTIVAPGWLSRLACHLERDRDALVGPVTNRIGNEAQVAVPYRTYGGFRAHAAERAAAHDGESFEIGTLTMFCLAMSAEVHERLGSLDEGFGVGTLEDDDYSMRARRAGLRLRCAEDVLVHHFGEGSFGRLVPGGERDRILEENRRRFEEKWRVPWQPYERRPDAVYDRTVERARALIRGCVPAGGTVAVVSRGDDRLVELGGGLRGRHFPQADGGVWAGHHPADGEEAVQALEAARASGARYLAVPRTSFWWLDFYGALARRLDGATRLAADEHCIVFELEAAVSAAAARGSDDGG